MIRAAVKLTDRDRSWAGFYAQFTRKPYPTTGAVDRTRHADDAASTPDPGSRAVAPSINDMPSAYVSVPSYNDNKTSGRAPTAPAPEVMQAERVAVIEECRAAVASIRANDGSDGAFVRARALVEAEAALLALTAK